jgi:branched-chain amino acid transport system substrate-binding protein
MLKGQAPDIQIVGVSCTPAEGHRLPALAKIEASGADTVITGNWSQDFALLLKAAADAPACRSTGTPITPAARAVLPPSNRPAGPCTSCHVRRVRQRRSCGLANDREGLPRKYGVSIFYPRAFNQMRMLAAAIDKAKSTDPNKIGRRWKT